MKTTQKWSKVFLTGMAAIVLPFGLVLAGCSTDSGGGGGGGTLTVNNCPSSGIVFICDSVEPTTQIQLVGLTSGAIADGQAESATSYRLIKNSGAVFNNTGDFLVILNIGPNYYFKNVSFNNGSGSVDYDSMTPHTNLPTM